VAIDGAKLRDGLKAEHGAKARLASAHYDLQLVEKRREQYWNARRVSRLVRREQADVLGLKWFTQETTSRITDVIRVYPSTGKNGFGAVD
jgi:hypothetical protein